MELLPACWTDERDSTKHMDSRNADSLETPPHLHSEELASQTLQKEQNRSCVSLFGEARGHAFTFSGEDAPTSSKSLTGEVARWIAEVSAIQVSYAARDQ